jgi:cellulose synthase/poly-beta-1,6-N-acetylglucosamine synthase-like glycosyltransferase
VRVTAVARSGRTREVICNVLIDWKTPPGYGLWIARNEPTADGLRQMRREAGNFAVCPRISIAVPVYKTPIALLTRCIESVMDQTYPNWELCLADDGSHDAALAGLLQQYSKRDARIRIVALPAEPRNLRRYQCGLESVYGRVRGLSGSRRRTRRLRTYPKLSRPSMTSGYRAVLFR